MRLLDTNVLSQLTRPRPDPGVIAELGRWHSDTVFASAVTRYELRYGAALRDDAAQFWTRLESEILPVVTWLPVSQEIAERGAVIAVDLRRRGRPCGDFDPLLAATALEHGLTLVTRNTRHFEAVPGIALENWFTAS
ncbi:MAG: type II toxin-antitoxin system VapC family toxin [Halofilum sp. (in: g-proteobacteria)]|nr:type II toxin-antitoxin system VapC family toxin [Halofilum sp. (in: g-proteobacteria)]